MPSERFMRHHYGASGFVSKDAEQGVRVDSDEHITIIVGPIVRAVYGDTAELGHYKIAIDAYKLGVKSVLDFFNDTRAETEE